MAKAVEAAMRGKATGGRLADAVKAAGVTGLIALLLFVPMVGLKTESAPGGVVLIYRLPEAIGLSLAAAVIRLLLDLFVWRRAPVGPALAAKAAVNRTALLVSLGVAYVLGGYFFLVPGARIETASAIGNLFASLGAESRVQIGVELLGLLLAAAFVIGTAMALVLVVRRAGPMTLAEYLRQFPAALFVIAIALLVPGPMQRYALDTTIGILRRGELNVAAGLLLLTAFSIGAAMALVLVGRRVAAALPGRQAGTGQATGSAGLQAEYLRQFPVALLAIAVALPVLVAGRQQSYALDTAIQVLTYVMLGWGLNVVVGLAGLLDLGYVAFYAVGAYSYAMISTTFGWSFWVCLPLAGFFAALWGIILGFPVLRLRGDYLAIVTLAFGEMMRIVLLNWVSLTNGPNGISRIPKLSFFGLSFNANDTVNFHGVFGLEYDPIYRMIFMYYVILALALMVNLVSTRLRRLPLGRAWEALREDEIACRSLGINTVTTKLTAFAIGAMFGGFAGSFFASRQGFVSPESFVFQESALVLAIVVLGGMGSQIGVALAAIVLISFLEFFRDLQEYRMLIFGVSMMVIMVWRPRGIVASRTPSVLLKKLKAISGSLVKEGAG